MTIKVNSKFDSKEVTRIEGMGRDDLVTEINNVQAELAALVSQAQDPQKVKDGAEATVCFDYAAKNDKEGRDASQLKEKANNLKDFIRVARANLDKRQDLADFEKAIERGTVNKDIVLSAVASNGDKVEKSFFNKLEELEANNPNFVSAENVTNINGLVQHFDNASIDTFYNTMSTSSGISVDRPRSDRIVYQKDFANNVIPNLPVYAPVKGSDSYVYPLEAAGNIGSGNAVAGTGEGGLYATQSITSSNVTVTAVKLAAFTPITDEQLRDVNVARRFAETRLTRNLHNKIEVEGINGSGASDNWKGLLNQSDIQTITRDHRGSDKESILEPIITGLKDIRVTGKVEPDALVLGGETIYYLQQLKDTQGRYLWADVVSGDMNSVMGVPIIRSENITKKNDAQSTPVAQPRAFLINFSDFGLLDVKGVTMEWGYNGTDFSYGRKSVRIDVRGNILAFHPKSLVVMNNMGQTYSS